jgi:hypothetical protein
MGIPLSGKIEPLDPNNDDYPVTDPKYGLGGLRTVANLQEKYNIPYARRELGMLVFVQDQNAYYKLKNIGYDATATIGADWELLQISGQLGDIDAGNY